MQAFHHLAGRVMRWGKERRGKTTDVFVFVFGNCGGLECQGNVINRKNVHKTGELDDRLDAPCDPYHSFRRRRLLRMGSESRGRRYSRCRGLPRSQQDRSTPRRVLEIGWLKLAIR